MTIIEATTLLYWTVGDDQKMRMVMVFEIRKDLDAVEMLLG